MSNKEKGKDSKVGNSSSDPDAKICVDWNNSNLPREYVDWLTTGPAVRHLYTDWSETEAARLYQKIPTDWEERPSQNSLARIPTDWDQYSGTSSNGTVYTDWDLHQNQAKDSKWFLPLATTDLTKQIKLNPEQRRFRELIYPYSGDYPSSVPALFLFSLPNLRFLQRLPLVIARDGAIALCQFFAKHPHGPSFKTRIAIHENLLWVVPSAWKKSIVSYRLVGGPAENRPRGAIVYGMNSAAMVSPLSCEKALEEQKDTLAKAERIYLCLPSHFLSKTEPIQMHAEIARRIFAKIGTTADVVDWGQLLHGHSFEGYLTVNLNKDTLIADCWLSHALLQGGAILNTRPLSADELFMPVSRSHGFAVQMHPKFPKLTSGALKTEMAALTSSFEASVFDWTQLMGQGSRRGHA